MGPPTACNVCAKKIFVQGRSHHGDASPVRPSSSPWSNVDVCVPACSFGALVSGPRLRWREEERGKGRTSKGDRREDREDGKGGEENFHPKHGK